MKRGDGTLDREPEIALRPRPSLDLSDAAGPVLRLAATLSDADAAVLYALNGSLDVVARHAGDDWIPPEAFEGICRHVLDCDDALTSDDVDDEACATDGYWCGIRCPLPGEALPPTGLVILAPQAPARTPPLAELRDLLRHTVTERRRVLEQQLLVSLLGATDDAVLLTDCDQVIRYVNPGFTRLCGYEPDEILGRRPSMLQGPATDPDVLARIRAAVERRERVRVELVNYRKDGSPYWVELSIDPVIEPDGSCQYFVGISRDVSERKALEQRIREREASYRLLADHSTDLISRHAPDGTYRYASPACEALIGYTPDELLGRGAYELFHPDDLQAILESHVAILDAPDVATVQYRIRHKDGHWVWFETTSQNIRDDSGEVVELICASRDVTQRREVMERLRASEERWRTLVERSPDAILVHRRGVVLYANQAALRLVGASSLDDLLGLEVSTFVSDQDAERLRERLARLDAGEAVGPTDVTIVALDGRRVQGEVDAAPVTFEGEPAVQAVVRDVTMRRAQTRALDDARRHAEEMARMKSSLLANLSHEIRTPLTAILGFAEVLSLEGSVADRPAARLILDSGQRLLATINSVLDLARIESGAIELDLHPADIGQHVRRVVAMLEREAERRELGLVVDAPPTPLLARVDDAAFERVLTNLIGNALKFTPTGAVIVIVRTEDAHVAVEVLDTGPGIADDFLPHIFDEFAQESSGFGRRHEGTGLGLTLSRRLVEMMHGTLAAANRPEGGARLVVRLPLVSVPEPRR